MVWKEKLHTPHEGAGLFGYHAKDNRTDWSYSVNMIDMVDVYIFICFKYIYLHTSADDGICV